MTVENTAENKIPVSAAIEKRTWLTESKCDVYSDDAPESEILKLLGTDVGKNERTSAEDSGQADIASIAVGNNNSLLPVTINSDLMLAFSKLIASMLTSQPNGKSHNRAGEIPIAMILIPLALAAERPSSDKKRDTLPASEEPAHQEDVFLDRFPEMSRKRSITLEQRLLLLGCAFKGEATSLGEALEWLEARHCPVHCVKSQLSACVDKEEWKVAAPMFFASFFTSGQLRLEIREGIDERPIDSIDRPGWPDRRKIIDLTETGWRLWGETWRFLRKHDPLYPTYEYLLPAG